MGRWCWSRSRSSLLSHFNSFLAFRKRIGIGFSVIPPHFSCSLSLPLFFFLSLPLVFHPLKEIGIETEAGNGRVWIENHVMDSCGNWNLLSFSLSLTFSLTLSLTFSLFDSLLKSPVREITFTETRIDSRPFWCPVEFRREKNLIREMREGDWRERKKTR